MRLSLIGPGKTELHYQEFLKISKKSFDSQLEKIAQSLVNASVELELLPDKGICLELAKLYKEKGGETVIGTIPEDDKTFSIKHLKPYLNKKINGKPLFNKTINSGDWFKHDMTKALFGDAILYLGSSTGSDLERTGAEYLYQFLKHAEIHPEIKAGKDYTLFVYSPFLKNKKLHPEAEFYLKQEKIRLVYIKTPKELEMKLKNISKMFK